MTTKEKLMSTRKLSAAEILHTMRQAEQRGLDMRVATDTYSLRNMQGGKLYAVFGSQYDIEPKLASDDLAEVQRYVERKP